MKDWFDSIRSRFDERFSHDVGIDLGTSNTLVYVKGKGIVVNEPTVVAINNKTNQIVQIGSKAKDMIGRTPTHLRTVKPLTNGVISDFEFAQEFLAHLVRKAEEVVGKKFAGPTIVIGSPSGVTNVERRAIRHAARAAGARRVMLVEEPMLAAIGVRLQVQEATASLVVDIGGGTTDIALISLGGIVVSQHTTIAGEHFNQEIINSIRDSFKILIGEGTAEELKITTATLHDDNKVRRESVVRGRDLVTGLPREILITSSDLRAALMPSAEDLVKEIRNVIESAPPEVASDVLSRGLVLVGGGALLSGLAEFIEQSLNIKVFSPDNPLLSIIEGAGRILEDVSHYEHAIISEDARFMNMS